MKALFRTTLFSLLLVLSLNAPPVSATVPYEGGSNDGHSMAEQTAAEVTDDDDAGGCFINTVMRTRTESDRPTAPSSQWGSRIKKYFALDRSSLSKLSWLVLSCLAVSGFIIYRP